MARSSNNRSIKAAIKPYKKESTYTNILPFPIILWVFGYVCFNFWMEWQNWDKLLENMSAPPPATPNATTLEKWMVVDIDNNAAIGVLRLEQVCNNLDIFDAIFLVMCIIVPILSVVRFILRQEKIFHETLKCKNGLQWFAGFVFLAFMRSVEALVFFVLLTMILPSSFFMCYRIVAMYFCTLTFAVFVAFIICIIITSAVSQSVLVFDVNYTSLGVVGNDSAIDVIETSRRKVRKRKKKKFKDNEGQSLIDETAYSDELDDDEKEYVDAVV
tara:strand:- start:740 stop:1555 length:816 start_codon:yes stop_codon:yes gene_type:complete